MRAGPPGLALALALGLALGLATTLASGRASALEKEHAIGASAGLAILDVADKSTPSVGAGFIAHYKYGWDDAFDVRVELGHAIVAAGETGDDKTPRTRPETVSHGAVGLAYVLDTLSWVPYLGLFGGAARLSGGTLVEPRVLPALQLALGLDKRFGANNRFAIGFAFRQHVFLTDAATYPAFTNAYARFEYTF